MRLKSQTWLSCVGLIAVLGAGCKSDSKAKPSTDAGSNTADTGTQASNDAGNNTKTDGGSTPGDAGKTLCDKYGGAKGVGGAIKDHVVPAIAMDCRVNTFFLSLPPEHLMRVSDCLAIQAEELFGCAGVKYAGSKASNMLPCRSMKEAHSGMGVSTGDFDALLEDVVAGLTEAGVEAADIKAAAPALMGMKTDIVEKASTATPSMAMCAEDGGAADGG